MKKTLTLLALPIAASVALTLAGCGTPFSTTTTVPIVTPPSAVGAPAVTNYVMLPVTNYLPSTAATTTATYIQAAAPLLPAPWGTAATALASLIAIAAGYVAKKQNDNANASAAAAATLAATVVAHPDAAALTVQATKIAAANGSTQAVATALASANSPT
jgi:hypothetical protein